MTKQQTSTRSWSQRIFGIFDKKLLKLLFDYQISCNFLLINQLIVSSVKRKLNKCENTKESELLSTQSITESRPHCTDVHVTQVKWVTLG